MFVIDDLKIKDAVDQIMISKGTANLAYKIQNTQ